MTGYSFRATRWRTVRLVLVLGVAMAGGERSFIFQTLLTGAHAQSYGASLGFLSLPIETVSFVITNPTGDKAYNDRVTDGFRRYLAVYPGELFNENRAAFAIARARRSPQVENVTYEYALGRAGGLDITFRITLADGARTETGHGYLLTNNAADLPVLYDLGRHLCAAPSSRPCRSITATTTRGTASPARCWPATRWSRERRPAAATATGSKAMCITASTASRR